jgi:hypothetical protein
MAKPITALMQKEMTRQEFMATLALGVGSIMGFSTIIHLLTGRSLNSHLGHTSAGYGSTAYGGGREK